MILDTVFLAANRSTAIEVNVGAVVNVLGRSGPIPDSCGRRPRAAMKSAARCDVDAAPA